MWKKTNDSTFYLSVTAPSIGFWKFKGVAIGTKAYISLFSSSLISVYGVTELSTNVSLSIER